MARQAKKKPDNFLFEGSEWNFDTLSRAYDAIEEIALKDLGLNVYANQIEIISSEQMLDAYSSIGMPLMYRHWSFGKHFVHGGSCFVRRYKFENFDFSGALVDFNLACLCGKSETPYILDKLRFDIPIFRDIIRPPALYRYGCFQFADGVSSQISHGHRSLRQSRHHTNLSSGACLHNYALDFPLRFAH